MLVVAVWYVLSVVRRVFCVVCCALMIVVVRCCSCVVCWSLVVRVFCCIVDACVSLLGVRGVLFRACCLVFRVLFVGRWLLFLV